MERKRFIRTKSQAGAWFIKDTKDGSLVAIMQKGSRAPEKTEAMLNVMLAALNLAGRPKEEENGEIKN